MRRDRMAGRLGNIIYWTACGISGLALLLTVYVAVAAADGSALWATIYGASAVGIWLLGRAARYVLSAK